MEEHLVFISHSSKDAPIGQLICHRLEEAGIRCWIAPRDIKWGDWANAIMDGLDRADVCVTIVDEHYIESTECPKELAEATRTCKYIIPFKLDMAELTPTVRYHLGPCHWLDASTPPLEQRVDELVERVRHLSEHDAVYINQRQLKLRGHDVFPKPLFLGRDDELAETAAMLQEEGTVFLQGMGGIGKSEIAKSYAKAYKDRYDTVVFLGYEGSISDLVTSDKLLIENLPPQDTENESKADYFRRKMDALRTVTSARTLLILDNYDVDDDPDFPALDNLPCHLLVTTRNEHDDYACIKIGPIADFDTVRTIFLKAYGKKLKTGEAEAVDEMIRFVGSHTITVELLARQMKASHCKAWEMLDRLKTGGVNTHYKETIGKDKADGSAFDHILRLFETADLTPEQEQILLWMSMMPYTGMEIGLFHDICELDDYDDLNILIAHSWLNLDEDTDVLSMHPIIADVVRDRLKPDVEKGKTYIAGLWREVGSLWFNSREERAEMWPYYAYLIKHFYDPVPELWTEFGYLENNAWICGHYELSIETGHRFLAYTKNHFPDDYNKIGIAANWLGGCYHNSGDDVHAAPYYEEGLENQLKNIRKDSDYAQWNELGNVYQKVGRCAYMAGDFEKSQKCFEEARRIGEEKCDKKGYYCNALLETGCMYEAMGEYEKAISYLQASQALYEEISGKENPNSASSLTNIGKCCIQTGRLDEAEAALNEALRLNIKFNGTDNRQTFWNKEAIADLAAARGNKAQALEMYQELEVEMAQCFGEQSSDLKRIREKIG